jgi:hypothetical protein
MASLIIPRAYNSLARSFKSNAHAVFSDTSKCCNACAVDATWACAFNTFSSLSDASAKDPSGRRRLYSAVNPRCLNCSDMTSSGVGWCMSIGTVPCSGGGSVTVGGPSMASSFNL